MTTVKSLVLDLAVDREAASSLSHRLPEASVRLRLEDLRELGAYRAFRKLREHRFDRLVVIVNDLRAQRRWLSILALALTVRAKIRELLSPAGQVRRVTWLSVVTREIPFVLHRTVTSLMIRRRVRRQVLRLAPASSPRPVRPRRVALLRADLSPSLRAGGSLAHMQGVCGGFERLGIPVTLVTPGEVRGFDEARVRQVPLDDRYRLLPELPYLAYNLDLLPRAVQILRSVEADLVYHRHALGCYSAAAAARACGLPLVVEYNGPEVWIAKHWGHGLRHAELFEEIERRALSAADLVVAVSEPLRQHLEEAGVADERILVNPNGVDPERFDPGRFESRRETIRDGLQVTPEEILVGFVGTFGPWHGAEVLAQAACRVPEARSRRLRYLFIGEGESRARTETILKEGGRAARARFTGLVPQEETPGLLSALDICVSPHVPNPDGSPFFGSPTKLFEYMASGRAILASKLGQIADVLSHDQNAWLVPPGDVDSLAEGLVRLAGDPGLRERLAAEGRKDAVERHSWTAHVERILERLANPAGGRP